LNVNLTTEVDGVWATAAAAETGVKGDLVRDLVELLEQCFWPSVSVAHGMQLVDYLVKDCELIRFHGASYIAMSIDLHNALWDS
jgi:hypothetical protein